MKVRVFPYDIKNKIDCFADARNDDEKEHVTLRPVAVAVANLLAYG